MFLDSQLEFSNAQALTATAVSTNDIDLGVDRDIGIGEPMAIVITVGVDADFTTTDETYQFQLLTDNDVAFGSATVLSTTSAINGDDLTAGKSVVIPIGYTNERYLRMNNILAGTTPTITLDAYLQPMSMIDGKVDYANGYDIT